MAPHPQPFTARPAAAAPALGLGLFLGLALSLTVMAPPAAAQGCGDSYTIRAGDTLSAVAARCGVSLDALMAANPGIEPRRLAVGQAVALPGAAAAAAPAAPPSAPSDAEAAVQPSAEQGMAGPADVVAQPHLEAPQNANYTVRASDTLATIAQSFGTTVTEVVKNNPQLNRQTALVPGQRIHVPGAGRKAAAPSLAEAGTPWSDVRYIPGAAVEVLPRQVEAGDLVTIYARGFPARTQVDIAAGDPAGVLVVLDQEMTDNYGTLRARVSVPRDVVPGQAVAVVVATPDRTMAARSAGLTVNTAGQMARTEPGAPVELVGTLTDEGVTCPALRTAEGILYTLTGGQMVGLQAGDRVRVVGLIAGASTCQQGVTVSAARIEAVRPERAER